MTNCPIGTLRGSIPSYPNGDDSTSPSYPSHQRGKLHNAQQQQQQLHLHCGRTTAPSCSHCFASAQTATSSSPISQSFFVLSHNKSGRSPIAHREIRGMSQWPRRDDRRRRRRRRGSLGRESLRGSSLMCCGFSPSMWVFVFVLFVSIILRRSFVRSFVHLYLF